MELVQASKDYHAIHSLVYSCQYHVIFCTKYRRKVFYLPLDERLKALILEKQDAYGYSDYGAKQRGSDASTSFSL